MKKANFYPGPSRVYSNITEYIYEAYMEGIMSINHRSTAFMHLMEQTKATLRKQLLIPAEYEIVFTSSASECWEIIAQSLTQKGSQHFFNGAFGEKWEGFASNITQTVSTSFGINEVLPVAKVSSHVDVLCVTQNETSNGTAVAMSVLGQLRQANPERLITVDCTSSLAGVAIDFELADVWYASVQKCFGLPAGMGLMILSPKAREVAYRINENGRYNSLVRILENAEKNQTAYTPNVLGIFLLYKTQMACKGIGYIDQKLRDRMKAHEVFFSEIKSIDMLVENEQVRSQTVLALTTKDPDKIKHEALERGVILGNGYGPWKSSTFRIANFPAIKSREIEKLRQFFAKHY